MKFGLLFSGQGSQKTGIALDFMNDPLFNETIKLASNVSQIDLERVFQNEEGQLEKTRTLQPALVAFEAGIARMLERDLPDLQVGGMIGLSLGEYGAMYASHALGLSDTIKLVSARAQYMQADADKVENAMAALIKPDLPEIEKVLANLQAEGKQVYVANYNSPKQVVIAGVKQDVAQATAELADYAKKIIPLNVNGAFHTPLFNEASKKMHEYLKHVTFLKNQVPVISNTTMKPLTNDWGEVMERQLAVPTHFGECLKYLIKESQLEATLEIGPGKTLTSFAKQVDRNLKNYRIGNLAEYQQFIEEENGFNK